MSVEQFVEVVDVPAVQKWITTELYQEMRRANMKDGLTEADMLYGLVCALVAYAGMIKLTSLEAADVVNLCIDKMESMLQNRGSIEEAIKAMDKAKAH